MMARPPLERFDDKMGSVRRLYRNKKMNMIWGNLHRQYIPPFLYRQLQKYLSYSSRYISHQNSLSSFGDKDKMVVEEEFDVVMSLILW